MDCDAISFKTQCYLTALLLLVVQQGFAHGFVGKRFFPSAISQDEPFINDKIALPVFYTEAPGPNGSDTWTTNPKLEYAKRITKSFQASATASYLHINNSTENTRNGFDN